MHPANNYNFPKYLRFDWADLIKVNSMLGLENFPTLLANHNILLFPEKCCLKQNQLNVVTFYNEFMINKDDLTISDNKFLKNRGIVYAIMSFDHQCFPQRNINDGEYIHKIHSLYLNHCLFICNEAIAKTKQILNFINEYLSNRIADNMKLSEHQVIKFTIADIICHIKSAEALLHAEQTIHSLFVTINELLTALHSLAVLGGGRSILKGNTLEYLFYLKIIQSVYLTI